MVSVDRCRPPPCAQPIRMNQREALPLRLVVASDQCLGEGCAVTHSAQFLSSPDDGANVDGIWITIWTRDQYSSRRLRICRHLLADAVPPTVRPRLRRPPPPWAP